MKHYKTKLPLLTLKETKTEYQKAKISSASDAYNVIKPFFKDDVNLYESFYILLLNRANNTIGYSKISQGGVCGTVVDIQIICKYVVESLAKGVILAHNHPSGNLKASKADIEVTKKIKKSLDIFEVQLLDHLIITEDSYLSLDKELNFVF